MSKKHNDIYERKAKEVWHAELKSAFENETKDVKVDIIDEVSYNSAKKLNPGKYSEQVFQFVENWAKLMQVQLDKVIVTGEVIDPTQKKFYDVLDECAINCYKRLGFMILNSNQFAFALGILGQHWRFGTALRDWYKGYKAKAGVVEVDTKDGEGE